MRSEIQTPEYGFGLPGVLRARSERPYGILMASTTASGIREPTHIQRIMRPEDWSGKRTCKLDLIRTFGFDEGRSVGPARRGFASGGAKGTDLCTDCAPARRTFTGPVGTGEADPGTALIKAAARIRDASGSASDTMRRWRTKSRQVPIYS